MLTKPCRRTQISNFNKAIYRHQRDRREDSPFNMVWNSSSKIDNCGQSMKAAVVWLVNSWTRTRPSHWNAIRCNSLIKMRWNSLNWLSNWNNYFWIRSTAQTTKLKDSDCKCCTCSQKNNTRHQSPFNRSWLLLINIKILLRLINWLTLLSQVYLRFH